MPIQARLIHPTGTRISLRRFVMANDDRSCPVSGYHTAEVVIDESDEHVEQFWDDPIQRSPTLYQEDTRWPTYCACGYTFTDSDEWQVNHKRRWSTDSGVPEPGDLFWATWHHSGTPHLYAICPDGRLWDCDGPSSNGNGWTRTGDPPAITCSPSIWTDMPHGYHGFLQGGVFTDDLSGKVFDAKPYGYM